MKNDLSYDYMMHPDLLHLANVDDVQALAMLDKPELAVVRRSFSCPGHLQYQFDTAMTNHHHRIRIAYYNDAVRERSQANAQRLLLLAAAALASNATTSEPDGDVCESNSTILARKALRYRKIYDRMDGVDVKDPHFNASQFLGVTWHKLVP